MRRPSKKNLPVIAFLASTAACAGGTGHPHGGHQGPPVMGEIEPNDSPYAPDYLGAVDTWSHFIVEGRVHAHGPDLLDHFELYADEPVGLEFWLSGTAPGADLDLSLWDPDSEQLIATFDSSWNPEEGYFSLDWAGKRVVLVVEAWSVDTSYNLEILGSAHPYDNEASNPAPGAATASEFGGVSFPDGRPGATPSKAKPIHPGLGPAFSTPQGVTRAQVPGAGRLPIR